MTDTRIPSAALPDVRPRGGILVRCERYPELKRMLQLKLTEARMAEEQEDEPRQKRAEEQARRLRAEMGEIEEQIENHRSLSAFRRDYRTGEEQLFLRYHYIVGFSMERTAEAMDISRDTVYRIRRRLAQNTDARGRRVV